MHSSQIPSAGHTASTQQMLAALINAPLRESSSRSLTSHCLLTPPLLPGKPLPWASRKAIPAHELTSLASWWRRQTCPLPLFRVRPAHSGRHMVIGSPSFRLGDPKACPHGPADCKGSPAGGSLTEARSRRLSPSVPQMLTATLLPQ